MFLLSISIVRSVISRPGGLVMAWRRVVGSRKVVW